MIRFLQFLKTAGLFAFLMGALIGCPTAASGQDAPPPSTPDGTPAAPSPTSEVEAPPYAKRDPLKVLEDIQKRAGEFKQALTKMESKLETVDEASSVSALAKVYQRHIEMLHSLEASLVQQATAVEQTTLLRQQKKQTQEELAKIAGGEQKAGTLLELDRLRANLAAEEVRNSALEAKLKIAETNLEQAKSALNTSADATRLETQKAEEDLLTKAESNIRDDLTWTMNELDGMLRRETVFLREIEWVNVQLEMENLQLKIELTTQMIEALAESALFTREDLEEQTRKLNRLKLDLTREVSRQNDQKGIVRSRWTAVSEKLSATINSDEALRHEVEARRLAMESVSMRIDVLNARLPLIDQRLTAWDRRFQVYNNLVEDPKTLQDWENEALTILKGFENDLFLLNSRIDSRQAERTALFNALEQLPDDSKVIRQWLDAQSRYLAEMIASVEEHKNAIGQTSGLLQKLVDEINAMTAMQTFSERMKNLLQYQLHNDNTALDWLIALSATLLFFTVPFFTRRIIMFRLRRLPPKDKTPVLQYILNSLERINRLFMVIAALYIGSLFLNLTVEERKVVDKTILIALIFQAGILISFNVRRWIFSYLMRKSKRDASSMSALSIFNFISQIVVWTVVLILVVENMGFDATALVTGLGIGGIAVALALQNVLSDLFGSLSIVLDKPFVIGDFIIFDNFGFLGTVEHIGIKTTRLRSISGEQIVCSNNDLLNTRIRNFQRMNERRVVFKVGVTYQTKHDLLKEIPEILKTAVNRHESTRFDRAHFQSFGDFALMFEVVYYILCADYVVYMDTQQAINLEIFQIFEEKGIEFAYPTQTIHLPHEERTISSPPEG